MQEVELKSKREELDAILNFLPTPVLVVKKDDVETPLYNNNAYESWKDIITVKPFKEGWDEQGSSITNFWDYLQNKIEDKIELTFYDNANPTNLIYLF